MYERHIEPKLLMAMTDTPVILLNGARQTGKSTLAKILAENLPNTKYYNLDNLVDLAAVQTDPENFVNHPETTLIIDEVQKAPELFLAIKQTVDENRRPGRFLLTGSTNIFLLPQISESLAGRMEIISFWPLSQGEIKNSPENFIDNLFADEFNTLSPEVLAREELITAIIRGGYPEPLTRSTPARRKAWFNSYITAILQRDIRDYSQIEALSALPRLLALLAARSASLMNYAELSRSSGIPQTTLVRYITLLKATFLVHEVLPWSGNFSKRLVKSPKVYLNDTGLMTHLLGVDLKHLLDDPNHLGNLLENFVVNELKKQMEWNETIVTMLHYRSQGGQEIDIILENMAGQCVGIEVKASGILTKKDFAILSSFAEELGEKFIRGIVLYTGDKFLSFGENLYAVPITALWGSKI